MGSVNTSGLNLFAGDPFLSAAKSTGRTFYVGNASTYVPGGVAGVNEPGNGNSPKQPFATIDYAVGQCTAGRGDVIIVLPGHVESITAAGGLDLDVAGITILFLGDGATRGTIRFGTAVGADMDVDAADITLGAKGQDLGPRFLANLDALTGPIDVNSARFRMYNATWNDGTSINTTDCLVGDANADNMIIDGFEFVDGNAAGTQKQSFIQVAGATGIILRGIKCTGDFGTGIIENGTAWIDALLEDLVLDNASATPTVALLLQATSSGWVRNSSLRVASGTTGYTAANDMQFDNVGVIGTDAYGAGSTALGGTADAAATGAVTATDSVIAYIKQIVTMLGPTELDTDTLGEILVGTAGISTFPTGVAAANAVSLAEVIRYLQENVIVGTGTAMPANSSLYGVLAGATGVPTYPAAAAPGDAVSLAEVIRAIYNHSLGSAPQYNHVNYLSVAVDLTSATWNTVATHEVLTVTGAVRVRILPVISEAVTSGGALTAQYGIAGATTAFVGSTALAALIIDSAWLSTTPAAQYAYTSLVDRVVVAGTDIGYEIGTAAATDGTITFHCWWVPLDSTGAVVAGAGGAL